MDIPAVKPVSGVVAARPSKAGAADLMADSGRELPSPRPRPVHLDPQVLADLSERKAAVAHQVSEYLRSNSRELQFMVDVESGDAVIIVRDSGGNVVRRIPGEDALQMLRRATVELGTFVDFMV